MERIAQSILFIRDQKVMLDADLADLYGVDTRTLVQAVRRNMDRFPVDFMFRLTKPEFDDLRSQFVISNRGGRRYPPLLVLDSAIAFTQTRLTKSIIRMPIYALRKTGYIFVV